MSRRKILSLALALTLTLPLLSACHGSRTRQGFTIPDTFDGSKTINLVFWAKNDTNKNQTAVYRQAIDDFQKIYPNVTIDMRLYADYGRIYQDVITNISTDTTPNICITYPDHIATYLTGDNVVTPLDGLIHDEKFGLGGTEVRFDAPKPEEMVPEFMEECKIGETTYAIPFMRSTEALYINQDFVEKLGYKVPDILTWDFIWEVSEKAMEKNEDGTFKLNGQNVLIPFIYKSTDNMMISMLKQLNAPYSSEDGEVLIFTDTTRDLLEEIYTHAKSRAFSTFAVSSYPGNFLNAGQCVFALDSTAGATWMGSKAPMMDIHKEQVVDFTTVVRPIPQFNPDHPQMISQGPSVCIFQKTDAQEVLASWLFVQYLVSNDIQLGYAETEGYLPVTLKASESAEYRDYVSRKGEDNSEHYNIKIDASELLRAHTADTFTTPVFNGSASLRSAAGQMVENVTKSARRKEAISDEYFTKLFNDVTSLYRLDQIGKAGEEAADTSMKELPGETKALLIAIPAIWIVIGAVQLVQLKKNRKKKEN